ncbi:putative arylalkylamine n-acetyltransferase [Streptococcus oralis]|uniref:Putative arylalkylamine n-acetyltransferase n=1 Tax=Streptococcus oralis TaxID=1303 RepID=A0A139RL22_STROR|nr:GNAT family N-acetyltransferase [Streptococcus oralis]KXU15424.1 putative arylalkylamine n-acetyltransferase [Streptococcus oralis]
MEIPVLIRFVTAADFEEILAIEQANFPPAEAASPKALKERIERISDSFLVAEIEEKLVGYIVGPAVFSRHLTDNSFETVVSNPDQQGYIAVQSLSIHPDFQGQGLGTLLLAALKETVRAQERQGISLTCPDYLISFYEMNGFQDEGLSESVQGGETWYDMVWENPYYEE